MTSYSAMINSWSLLYDEIYGDDEMSPCKTDHVDDNTVFTVGSGNTASTTTFNIDPPDIKSISIDTSAFPNVDYDLSGVDFAVAPTLDDIVFSDTPIPGIESNNPRKYKEDESIKALQDYISTTYNGHYTSEQNNVQTLDLIESVGDAESFCRSNAIKYLSRYDKKGQAKRDILKALHYSLLLYHFSGQLNETTTRGYETF